MKRRQRVTCVVMAAALGCWSAAPAGWGAGFSEVTPASKAAALRGLAWLAATQQRDGSWVTDTGRPDHLGLMGLACLAFMSAGSTPGKGEYGRQLSLGLKYIMDNQKPNGLLNIGPATYDMYNHGLATLTLSEAYGMSHDPRIKSKLVQAVDLIVECQSADGGWTYQAVKGAHDTSICVMEMMALRGAVNCGIYVPKETIDKGVKWLLGRYNPKTGGFGYSSPHPTTGMTAAGAVSLQAAGKLTWDSKEGEPVRKSLDWLLANTESKALPRAGYGSLGFYHAYYFAQCMFQAGGKYWQQTYPQLRDNLVGMQQPSGYWSFGATGPMMSTSVAVIILSIPNRYLPIFQEERDESVSSER